MTVLGNEYINDVLTLAIFCRAFILRYLTSQGVCIKNFLRSISLKSVDKTCPKIQRKRPRGSVFISLIFILFHLFALKMQFSLYWQLSQVFLTKQNIYIKYCFKSCAMVSLNKVIKKKIYIKPQNFFHDLFALKPGLFFNMNNLIWVCNWCD